MNWTWRLEAADGTALPAPVPPSHPSQADAESWLGEQWRELREDGVARVTLVDADTEVYGPMPLSET